MLFYLYANEKKIGKIYIQSGSKHTKEFRGVLIPSENYNNVRNAIYRYPECYRKWKDEGSDLDALKAKKLKEHLKLLKEYYSIKFDIKSEAEESVTTSHTYILVIDNYTRTGLGNWFIEVIAEKLNIPENYSEFLNYTVEWLYPSNPPNQVGIKYKDEIVLQY